MKRVGKPVFFIVSILIVLLTVVSFTGISTIYGDKKMCIRDRVVAHRVHSKEADEIVGVDDVAFRLAHLICAEQQPGVAKDLFGQRLAQCHQNDGPVDGVEPKDILADDVDVCGPVFFVEVTRCV